MKFLLLALLSCICSADDRHSKSFKQWPKKIDIAKIENISRVASQIHRRDLNYLNGYVDLTDTVVRLRHYNHKKFSRFHGDDVEIRHPIRHGHHQFQSIDTNNKIIWPVKKEAVIKGDLVLGGLMMVHEREDTIMCGPVMPQGGIQALEAMLYTLDKLNDREIVPGVKIGAHILDDCDKDTYGLEMAVDFIKGTYTR
ncbi:Metabotropic glutamate receptor 2 [Camponotus floridanus]|uniref:Metabotropic glutamate receptor 2 n=1 Tax=Camponotus floridanus TaxID=104421 RepID=E2AUR3_CAMFO|nr:Metabotropic glutamate receptor 2 [Camponotus floridanus]